MWWLHRLYWGAAMLMHQPACRCACCPRAGVLCWELIMGHQPYAGMTHGQVGPRAVGLGIGGLGPWGGEACRPCRDPAEGLGLWT